MSDTNTPKLGEIWEDAEGTLMVYAATDTTGTHWFWVFANAHPIAETNEKMVHPLRRIFDEEGNLDIDLIENGVRLRYPGGHNVV